MPHRFSYLLLVSFLIHGLTLSQESLSGKILDIETLQPVIGVNVYQPASKSGTSTDVQGIFKIDYDALPLVLQLSHIGYENQNLVLENSPDTLFTIYLRPAISQLEEVVVSADAVTSLSEVNEYSIRDYEIIDDKILRLDYYGHFTHQTLSVSDLDGKILESLSLKGLKYIEGLYKSCTDQPYLITAVSAIPIFFDGYLPQLGEPFDIDTLDQFIRPCQARLGENLYYLFEQFNGLRKVIRSYNTQSNEAQTTRVLSVPAERIENYLEDQAKIQAGIPLGSAALLDNVGAGRMLADAYFFTHQFYQPKYPVHLGLHLDALVIFNHPELKLEFYQENRLQRQVEINYPEERLWLKSLIVDEMTQNVFALFRHKIGVAVRKINFETGQTDLVGLIDSQVHQTKKIMVHNNHLYYLKSHPNYLQNKELVRQRL